MANLEKILEKGEKTGMFSWQKPEQAEDYEKLGIWKIAAKYNAEIPITAGVPEKLNYTKLKNGKKAKKLADRLQGDFLGFYAKIHDWLVFEEDKFYKVEEDKKTVKATYDLGRNSVLDLYHRVIEYQADKETGEVNIIYKTTEAVPERVIAKDLKTIYKALSKRGNFYFEKNPAAQVNPNPQDTPAPAPQPAPGNGYEAWAQTGMQNGYIQRLVAALQNIQAGPQPEGN